MGVIVADLGAGISLNAGSDGAVAGIKSTADSINNTARSTEQIMKLAFVDSLKNPTYGTTTFYPRTTTPGKGNKCWLKAPTYGYNRAVEILAWEGRYEPHSCLPNCVGYCWGRVYELSKQYGTELPTGILSTGNAKNWYPNMSKWAKGKEPRLGSVICWTNSSYGHVAMVEKINYDDNGNIKSIQISESGYLWKVFNLNTKYPSNNYAYSAKTPTLQGFIYPPYTSLFSRDASGSANQVCLNLTTVFVKDKETGKYVQGSKSNYVASLPGIDTQAPPPETPIAFNAGNRVKVKGKGNTNKLGTGKEVSVIGQTFTIKSIHKGFQFMYRIGNDVRGIGYFREEDLELV